MGRVLVTEELAESGLAAMRSAGHDVDVQLGLSPDQLLDAVVGAHALVIRSATKVTAAVFAAGRDLVMVGRAGVGIDNVDVGAATQAGVMVVNAPKANTVSMAEHTLGLLLAVARNIPQADAALKAGRWERSRWEGVELFDHTLGILGLGNTGSLVAQRAHAFGMKVLGWDPWMAPERARQMNVELVELDELMARADFVTTHLNKTPDTIGLIGKDLLAKAKAGIRIVNCARGGIVDEEALADALTSGHVAGAALDVFAAEPTTESPLFGLANVVVTPHLGASTAEAQDKAGVAIAEMVVLALAGDFVPYAVNVSASGASETVRPYLGLAERLGRMFAALSGGLPADLEISYQGGLAEHDTRILTLSVLKGLFGAGSDDPVSYVNAPQLAAERGLEVKESSTTAAHDYVNLVRLSGGGRSVAGTLAGLRAEPRLVEVDGHKVDVPPAGNLLIVRNDDRAGMLAAVTSALADAGISIENMALGKSPDSPTALSVIATYAPVPDAVLDGLRATDGILSVAALN